MAEIFDRTQRAIPGGVDSPVRAFGSVGGDPVFIDRARGVVNSLQVDGSMCKLLLC